MSKISIVVPIYDVEKYLSVCIDSILDQTFSDFDLVLVDDGSPDNCGEICEEYARKDSRIYVIHKQNGGLSDARNYGIEWCLKSSDSEWITFVGSDDYLHPCYLEKLYKATTENGVNVGCCHYKTVYDHTESTADCTNNTDLLSPEDFFVESFCDSISPIHNCAWAKLYKKSFFNNIRYPFGRYYEDAYTTHLILFSQEKIAVLSDMLYFYFINPEGITLAKVTKKHIKDRYDSKICRLQYFGENNFRKAFELIFDEACFDIHKWSYIYKNDNDLKELVASNKKDLLEVVNSIKTPPDFNYKKRYKSQLKKAKKYFKDLVYDDYKNMKKSTPYPIVLLFTAKKLVEIFLFFK